MTDNRLIVSAALFGNGTTKEMNPATPYYPEEIAEDAVKCVRAGASILHLHARDKNGVPTLDPGCFRDNYEAVKDALKKEGLDAIVNLSTGGLGSTEERIEHIRQLKPEICSYNPGSINWGMKYVYNNPPEYLRGLGEVCREYGIRPEIEIFDTGMFDIVKMAIKEGVLAEPCYFQLVLGIGGGLEMSLNSLKFLLDHMPEGSLWSLTGIGRYHMPAMLAGLAAGCNGIRCGLEDGVWLWKGVPATNELFVKQAVELGKAAGRTIATAEDAREILGLKK